MIAPLQKNDITAALRQLGLDTGDLVLLHSSLSSLGHVAGGAACVVDAFLDVLGAEGTLVVPVFGALGVIPEEVRRRPEAVCSIHPLAAVAAIGARASELCAGHWQAELAHGPATPYTRLANAGGYVCLLGVDQDRNTTLHAAEEILRLPYLQTTAEHTFSTPDGPVTRAYPFFPGPHRDFIGLDRVLTVEGGMRVGRVGKAVVRLIRGADLLRVARRLGSADPAFALCANPHCDDCVRQRARLRQAHLGGESFSLVASGMLAGHYAEEIADQCIRAGITRVELDCVYGKPVNALQPECLEQTVRTLRAGDCEVVSLRLPASPDDPEALLGTASRLDIQRLVLPLTDQAPALAAAAQRWDITVSFSNVALSSQHATALMEAVRKAGYAAGFTFNPAQFAGVGEKPFLCSWQRRLKYAVDQLDVQDACFDGTVQRLGAGQAEIKELISILRCAGFAGHMVLAADNRHTGGLADTVQAFMELLERV